MNSDHTESPSRKRRDSPGLPIVPEKAARGYLDRGWSPLPIGRGEKGARFYGWTEFVCDPTVIDITFCQKNVGVLLGERSGGLVDVDLDCPEAEQLAEVFLLRTEAVFGRESKPRSHFLYRASPIPPTKKFAAPDGSTLVELRSSGVQTVFPGSVHPSGEYVVWARSGEPYLIDARELQQSVALLAGCTLIARSWPTKGSRQNTALALAGALHRAGVEGCRIPVIIEAVATTAGDEEAAARDRAAADTVRKLDEGKEATGWPTLGRIIDLKVVNRCHQWFDLAPVPTSSEGNGFGCGGGDNGDGGDDREGEWGENRRRARGPKPQSQLLIELAEANVVEFFRNGDEIYAMIAVGERGYRHRENHAIRRKHFRLWLRKIFYDKYTKPPGSQSLMVAIEQLDANAHFNAPEIPVFVRVASYKDEIYIDLCHPQWLAVRITSHGWTVCDQPPVKFIRKKGMKALPLPVPGGTIDLLRPFLVVRGDDWILTVGWLVGALRASGPFPILVLGGEPGATKSTAFRILRALVDPSVVPDRGEPSGPRDVAIAAENTWVLILDNLSSVKPWLSDVLCRISTGAGFATRELYTDADERLFYSQRPIALNGIGDVATRPDLIDRAVCITMGEIAKQQRREEGELWKAFERVRPRILGALYGAVAAALANHSTVSLPTLPRMADFAKWVVAAESGLGWVPGTFQRAHNENADAASQIALEGSPIAGPLMKLVLGRSTGWKGSAAKLLDELNQSSLVSERNRRSKFWPQSASFMGTLLRNIAPNLRRAGFLVEFRRTGKNRCWLIQGPNSPVSVEEMIQQLKKLPPSDGSQGGDGQVTPPGCHPRNCDSGPETRK